MGYYDDANQRVVKLTSHMLEMNFNPDTSSKYMWNPRVLVKTGGSSSYAGCAEHDETTTVAMGDLKNSVEWPSLPVNDNSVAPPRRPRKGSTLIVVQEATEPTVSLNSNPSTKTDASTPSGESILSSTTTTTSSPCCSSRVLYTAKVENLPGMESGTTTKGNMESSSSSWFVLAQNQMYVDVVKDQARRAAEAAAVPEHLRADERVEEEEKRQAVIVVDPNHTATNVSSQDRTRAESFESVGSISEVEVESSWTLLNEEDAVTVSPCWSEEEDGLSSDVAEQKSPGETESISRLFGWW